MISKTKVAVCPFNGTTGHRDQQWYDICRLVRFLTFVLVWLVCFKGRIVLEVLRSICPTSWACTQRSVVQKSFLSLLATHTTHNIRITPHTPHYTLHTTTHNKTATRIRIWIPNFPSLFFFTNFCRQPPLRPTTKSKTDTHKSLKYPRYHLVHVITQGGWVRCSSRANVSGSWSQRPPKGRYRHSASDYPSPTRINALEEQRQRARISTRDSAWSGSTDPMMDGVKQNGIFVDWNCVR